ncbi:hypothetical protein LINPERPRIM_LOCUS14119 [Linum perenne]
MGQRRRLR